MKPYNKTLRRLREIGESRSDEEYTYGAGYRLPSGLAVGSPGADEEIAPGIRGAGIKSAARLYGPGKEYRKIARPGADLSQMKRAAIAKMISDDANQTLAAGLAAYAGSFHPAASIDARHVGLGLAQKAFDSYENLMRMMPTKGRQRGRARRR